ncbi:CusA/CzcA family heavy metal efflux RND transporter [Solidesulfovibrio sp.]|uniref:efflux RND transporter permease subunit n=1 Tax=Solidesulfovibrio sp. TaxID=2910990 RepID=UPI00261F80FD|nr:CusA/CzcA family heavy metal efflux RND transporter [Solidesulfovibrio sp.]
MPIRAVIAASARNRFLVILATALCVLWGAWALRQTPLDAIPDLSDPQVIIYTDWAGRSPNLVEDQVTYPIVTSLLAAPKVRAVRGFSFFGSSFVYVIFEEGTDIYWARSRILEYLQSVTSKMPAGVTPQLGPDATSLGWGFSYALVDDGNRYDLGKLRSLQDYTLKLSLESVPGVAQVASLGGYVKQYQITVDPGKLQSQDIPLSRVLEAVKQSNTEVEGRVLEFSGIEYMVRGRGYLTGAADLEQISLGRNARGAPILLKDVAEVRIGPEIRRGVADLDGRGEAVGGVVVVRFGENVLSVIERVKEKIARDIAPTLPEGVRIVPTYDRSDLITRSVHTLTEEIVKLTVAVSVVCVVFLFHLPSALVVILTLPVAILMAFVCMHALGVSSNIMSLSGIAIAIGAMVDASIIMVENAHKRLEEWEQEGRPGSRTAVIVDAAVEVGPSLFFSLLVITLGFLPVFTLQSQAGRLFTPLAYTKTFAMLFASLLAVTLTPVLMTIFIRGTVRSEDHNPISRLLRLLYTPFAHLALRFKKTLLVLAVAVLAVTVIPFSRLGSEFMPPLYEGTLFYMPVTMPGASIGQAQKLLQYQDAVLMTIPEVEQVFGKAGRAETATDPAPLEMFETTINLKPESEWRAGMTVEKLKAEMDAKLAMPGVVNAFTMPIKARIDMLATGIRTPVGVKVLGPDLSTIEAAGEAIENAIRGVPGTRSVFAERVGTGYFLDIAVKRQEAARYGLSVGEVQDIVQSAVGGMNLTTTVEGRERYPVNVRYPRELRDSLDKLRRVLVPVMSRQEPGEGRKMGAWPSALPPPLGVAAAAGTAQIPLGELADIKVVKGPTVIKSEEGLLVSYVYVDFTGPDVGSYVERARQAVAGLSLPKGVRLVWSGEYEYLLATHERLKLVIPLTVALIFVLLYINTGSVASTCVVLLAVPFSLVGSFWFLYLLGYNMSIAVWIGLIALAGLDAETGVVMLLYLELAHAQWQREGRLRTRDDLNDAIFHGAVKRIRPKIMTVTVILAGLLPIMWSQGAGSDIMKRIAAPMIGGVVTSTILELLLYPAIYALWKGHGLPPGRK